LNAKSGAENRVEQRVEEVVEEVEMINNKKKPLNEWLLISNYW
jgi:hypothetical protein